MAVLTTADLVTRLKDRFRDTTNYVVSDAQWLAYLNEGYQEINGRHRWPWTRSTVTIPTVVGQTDYLLDASMDAEAVDAVYNLTNDELLVPEQGVSEYRVDYPSTYTGPPVQYRMFSTNTIQIFPKPDAVYSLKVDITGSPLDLTSGGAVPQPLWPNKYRRALIEYALARAYEDDGNADWAEAHRAHGESIVASMENDLVALPRNESYPQVLDNWY